MGEEIEFCHGDYIESDQCGNEISFRISGYEYPIGAFNYEDSEITGGRFEKEPHMGVIYSQDDFDPDDAYPAFTWVEQIILGIAQNRELIYGISPREIEAVIERVFQDEDFETKLTQQTRDGGRDIIVTTGHVTRGARRFVDDQNTMMSVIDVEEIHELIRRSAREYRGY